MSRTITWEPGQLYPLGDPQDPDQWGQVGPSEGHKQKGHPGCRDHVKIPLKSILQFLRLQTVSHRGPLPGRSETGTDPMTADMY
jgi:hypothetical protein